MRHGWMLGLMAWMMALPAWAGGFATEVVSYDPGSGTGLDFYTGLPYTNAANALGPPTQLVIPTEGVETNLAPVLPVRPAYAAEDLVSVGTGGHLILGFDEPIVDHPDHPYGVDFILFGNAFVSLEGGSTYEGEDPKTVVLGSGGAFEPGLVSVSEDGTNWVVFADGPSPDGFPGTLGQTYTGQTEDPWGSPTDPHLPVDPAVAASAVEGMSLAAWLTRFRGSAGGTGYDLADVGLATCRFVRIEGVSSVPEVDAVATVDPVPAFRLWQFEHIAWLEDPALETASADPDGDGVPNVLEYAVGGDPRSVNPSPAFSARLDPVAGGGSLRFTYTRQTAAADVLIRPETADRPGGPWLPVSSPTLTQPLPGGMERIEMTVPLEDGRAGFFRLAAEWTGMEAP